MEMTSYLTSSKMPFTDKDGHLTKAFQKEKTRNFKSIAERVSKQKLESSLIKSLSEKLTNSVLFERSFMYDSVCSIFLVARYAQWFPMENHENFGAPYLEF